MTEEKLHNHIKSVAEYYISRSWNSFLDLDTTDLIMAGIGVGKIIACEQEKRIADLEDTNKKISDECHKLVDSLEKKQNENIELIGKVAFLENDLNNAKAQIEKMKSDVIKSFGGEYNLLVAKLLKEWEIKEK